MELDAKFGEIMKYKCIDLFCGAGGLSKGFFDSGYDIIAGIDSNAEALVTFQKNHPTAKAICYDLSNDIFKSTDKDIIELLGSKVDILIGGPPCQGLSIAGKRIADDPRNKLYKAYINLIKHFKPIAVVLENVPTIRSLFEGKIADAIIDDFTKLGFCVSVNTVYASDYGVPQKRRRTFFVGLLKEAFTFPLPYTKQSPITCEQAISDLPLLQDELGGPCLPYSYKPVSDYQKLMREGSQFIYNHEAVEHTKRTKEIIRMVPDGGNYKDLPRELWNTRKVNIAWTRMNSNKPSFTIDAGHNHHFHYKADRVPTVRECARIQSFPDSFIFYGKRGSQYRQVGNAVPPLLAKAIADKLKEYLYVQS